MSSAQLYDSIGASYTVTRRTEPRIAARVWAALGDAADGAERRSGHRVLRAPRPPRARGRTVGAHAFAAPPDAAPCLAGSAEHLPFDDQSFDAAMAFSTIHHWHDPIDGLREMRRVARRVVVFTFDTSDPSQFWLTRDYLPEVAALRACRVLASLTELARAIGARMEPVPIPWDCADGFFEAYWRRPEAYLDENVRRGISVWGAVGPDAEAEGGAPAPRRPRLRSVGRTQPRPRRSRRSRARRSPAHRLTMTVIIGCCNLVEREGSYLLVRESKPSARGRFNLPAGKPELGETLVEAAVREAKEETGLDVEVDHIVGLYQCPRTSEGFGVVNFVFASRVTAGEIVVSEAHPEVRYFTRAEVSDLARRRLLRGSHIEPAMDAHARGQRLPLDILQVVPNSPLPAP